MRSLCAQSLGLLDRYAVRGAGNLHAESRFMPGVEEGAVIAIATSNRVSREKQRCIQVQYIESA